MAREMIEPSAALDALVEERIRPMSVQLSRIIGDILNRPPTDECVRLCAFSVVSQCTFYKHCNPVVVRLFPKQSEMDPAAIEQIADHITSFHWRREEFCLQAELSFETVSFLDYEKDEADFPGCWFCWR